MSIRCKHCESRVPEWDAIYGACPECYEEYRQANSGPEADEQVVMVSDAWMEEA